MDTYLSRSLSDFRYKQLSGRGYESHPRLTGTVRMNLPFTALACMAGPSGDSPPGPLWKSEAHIERQTWSDWYARAGLPSCNPSANYYCRNPLFYSAEHDLQPIPLAPSHLIFHFRIPILRQVNIALINPETSHNMIRIPTCRPLITEQSV